MRAVISAAGYCKAVSAPGHGSAISAKATPNRPSTVAAARAVGVDAGGRKHVLEPSTGSSSGTTTCWRRRRGW